jgi:cytochrome c
MPDGTGLPSGTGSVDAGRAIYAIQCQHCHGVEGQGKPFDQLVGRIDGDRFPFAQDPAAPRTIGSYWPYATTLFDYVRRAMPLEHPGSLGDAEVYSLTAYLLHLNGLLDSDAQLDRESLPQIVMPARDRFVPDDRVGGEDIR